LRHLFGHGFSAVPDLPYNDDLFVRQTHELLKYLLEIQQSVIIGFSLGGAIAARFTALHPELVKQLVLISPAGLSVKGPILAKFVKVPVLSDFIYRLIGRWLLLELVVKEFRETRSEQDNKLITRLRHIKAYQIDHSPSYMAVLLSILRDFPLSGMQRTFEELGKKNIPILLLMGAEDRVIPIASAQEFSKLMPNLRLMKVEAVGHYGCLQKPHDFVDQIASFLAPPDK